MSICLPFHEEAVLFFVLFLLSMLIWQCGFGSQSQSAEETRPPSNMAINNGRSKHPCTEYNPSAVPVIMAEKQKMPQYKPAHNNSV